MLFALDLHYNYILHGNFHLIDTLLLTCIGYTEPCCVVEVWLMMVTAGGSVECWCHLLPCCHWSTALPAFQEER